MEGYYCVACSAELTSTDIGFHKKMVNRGADEFMCIDCLCEYFGITREKAESMIETFKAAGCSLFL